jgi:hypothetical protein
VWPKFVLAVEAAAIGDDGKQGIIVAWNGKSWCDMEWIYRITQDNNNHRMQFPNNCDILWIPMPSSQTTRAALSARVK